MPQDLPPTKATVLISGEGSNLQALIDAAPLMPHLKIVRVISNKAGANGLNRAKAVSIPTAYHNLVSGKYYAAGEKDPAVKAAAREKYDADLAKLVLADSPDILTITEHYVISEVDRGEPIVIRKIQCKTPETLDELKARMHSQEHELILEGTQLAISHLWEKRSKSE
ncbi:Phosphoribosylglycinamide formyltransferase [Lachnellula arida]|uniref:phosphoribosylglycinamide formyltransferase 1 n=1 Tax=Lachnellula arida TaxID=1316785 RepID=A0A8T9AZ94_9HELO|nr:Phosphoribosylglycinamide formyltransferase [Lachnellula arida]